MAGAENARGHPMNSMMPYIPTGEFSHYFSLKSLNLARCLYQARCSVIITPADKKT